MSTKSYRKDIRHFASCTQTLARIELWKEFRSDMKDSWQEEVSSIVNCKEHYEQEQHESEKSLLRHGIREADISSYKDHAKQYEKMRMLTEEYDFRVHHVPLFIFVCKSNEKAA